MKLKSINNTLRAIIDSAWGVLLSVCFCILFESASAFAQAWDINSAPGQCTYSYDRTSDKTTASCLAIAILFKKGSSEVVRCVAEVSGDQSLAPSVEENVPDEVECRSLGRVFNKSGDFSIEGLDDSFVEERRKIRRRGVFVWSNAFWVYSQAEDLDLRICAVRKEIQNPDFGMRCSTSINWPDRD